MTNPQTERFPGIGKLIEEAGETLQLLGKAIAFPSEPHPDGRGTIESRIWEELADLSAAIDYFVIENNLATSEFYRRRDRKLALFREWKLSGIVKK